MWGEAPALTVLPKFDYSVAAECEDDDHSLHYMPEARPLGSEDEFSTLPDQITFHAVDRAITVCKCHEECFSADWDHEECKGIPVMQQWEIRVIAELRNSANAVLTTEKSEPFRVTFSPDCSTDTLIFTHNDFQDLTY
jgi:hypothetical protein